MELPADICRRRGKRAYGVRSRRHRAEPGDPPHDAARGAGDAGRLRLRVERVSVWRAQPRVDRPGPGLRVGRGPASRAPDQREWHRRFREHGRRRPALDQHRLHRPRHELALQHGLSVLLERGRPAGRMIGTMADFVPRDGTSQAGRLRPELDPNYAPVDERTTRDLLAFAKAYAGELNYFSVDDPDRAQ